MGYCLLAMMIPTARPIGHNDLHTAAKGNTYALHYYVLSYNPCTCMGYSWFSFLPYHSCVSRYKHIACQTRRIKLVYTTRDTNEIILSIIFKKPCLAPLF